MSRRVGPAIAAILLAAAPALGAEAAPEVRVRLDPVEATVGDLVTATLEVMDTGSAAAPTFPAWTERWGEAEIVVASPPARGGGATRQVITLRAFRTGRLELPPVEVTLDSPRGPITLRTRHDLALTLRSVLPETPAGAAALAPRPAAPPRGLPVGPAFLWSAAVGTALCLAALALLLWRRRREAAVGDAAAAMPPLAELAAALAAIATEPDVAAAHVALSVALRRYLGRRFGFPALESTSSEIRQALGQRPEALRAWGSGGGAALLQSLDYVKFARRPATRADLDQRIARALALGRDLEPPPPAAASPSEAAA
jgi:hypothetical protein